MSKYIVILLLVFPALLSAQENIRGTVFDEKGEPLYGATIHWLSTNIATSTDENGIFEISDKEVTNKQLIVNYVGLVPDTISIDKARTIQVILKNEQTLEEVNVSAERPGSFVSTVTPVKTEVITKTELTKSACCDLAGCFNTQASVEPTTTNIVTNAKELRILGLSGVYNQVLVDGMPLIQGMTYTYGVSTIPGTLVENIYVAKGANSVLQGFESISGQINVILAKPEISDKFLFNVFMNSFLEKQFNLNYSKKWKNWSTTLSGHVTQPSNQIDGDDDGFLDIPLLTRYSVFNKWQYRKESEFGLHSTIGLRFVDEQRIGGQKSFDPDSDKGSTNHYGQAVNFIQPEIYTKTGYRINTTQRFVLQAALNHHEQESYFGTTKYAGNQQQAYANLQFEQSWKKNHSLKAGVSIRHLKRTENISFSGNQLDRTYDGTYDRNEQIYGVFAENTFDWMDGKIVLIAGLRLDNHNNFGLFTTPRALLKYNFTDNTTARVSIGKGWRSVNLFSENINLMASSRDIVITEELNPEEAVNYGANFTHKIFGNDITTQLTFDFYRTQFSNQVFPDYDTDPTKAYVSNFTGTSISNGFQAEANFELYRTIGAKFAYNYLDVYRIINEEKFILPFNSKHRLTGSFSYKPLSRKWHFDMNVHWYGSQRLAKTLNNPPEFQLPETSDAYTIINAQITKSWEKLDIYGGCENIFNFRQNRPILSWENPFGPYFDTSSVWGPTRGREFYIGLRYKIQ